VRRGPAGRPGLAADRNYYGSDCDQRILRRGYERAGPPDDVTGRERGGGGNSELPAENGELSRAFLV